MRAIGAILLKGLANCHTPDIFVRVVGNIARIARIAQSTVVPKQPKHD
jgi:hypothetical protein